MAINYTHPTRTATAKPASGIDYSHPRRPRRDANGTVHLQRGQSIRIA